MISNTDYEKLLIENRKSFREALRRQRKANAILHAEIDRLKALIPVQEHKPESEDNQQDLTFAIAEKLDDIFEFRYIGDDKIQYAYEVESRLRSVLDDLGFEITKKK